MIQMELIQELKTLPLEDRLAFLELAIHSIREDLRQLQQLPLERERKLAAAAQALLPDYLAGGELTAFTALDGEDFHA